MYLQDSACTNIVAHVTNAIEHCSMRLLASVTLKKLQKLGNMQPSMVSQQAQHT